MDEKAEIILSLFGNYPSMASHPEIQVAGMLKSYTETLHSRSSQEVSSACERLSRRPREFAPSAGEIEAECQRAAEYSEKMEKLKSFGRPRLAFSQPAPVQRDVSFAEMANLESPINHNSPHTGYVLRVDEAGRPLQIPNGYPGAGQSVGYGYLTPCEVSLVRDAQSRRAESSRPRRAPFHEAAE